MKRSKYLSAGISVLLLLFSTLAINSFLETLHQGEDKLLVGMMVIFSAYLTMLFLLLGAATAFWRPALSGKFVVASFFIAVPSFSFSFYPALWCEFNKCGDGGNWPIVWDALLLPALVIIAGLLMKRASRL